MKVFVAWVGDYIHAVADPGGGGQGGHAPSPTPSKKTQFRISTHMHVGVNEALDLDLVESTYIEFHTLL